MTKLSDYLTIKEASEFLGVSQNTLRNWGKNGQIKERRHPINDYRLYYLDELKALLDRAKNK